MPSHLPNDHLPKRPRAKSIAAENSRQESAKKASRTNHAIETIDWLALWALSIAFCACFIAAIVIYNENDTVGASAVLAGAAGIIALVLLVSEAPNDKS